MRLWLEIMWKKSDTWWEEWAKLPKADDLKEKEKRKEKKSCSIVLWKVYIDGAWNQKKLSIGA
jgi:hypothetical protein